MTEKQKKKREKRHMRGRDKIGKKQKKRQQNVVEEKKQVGGGGDYVLWVVGVSVFMHSLFVCIRV